MSITIDYPLSLFSSLVDMRKIQMVYLQTRLSLLFLGIAILNQLREAHRWDRSFICGRVFSDFVYLVL